MAVYFLKKTSHLQILKLLSETDSHQSQVLSLFLVKLLGKSTSVVQCPMCQEIILKLLAHRRVTSYDIATISTLQLAELKFSHSTYDFIYLIVSLFDAMFSQA